MLCTLIKKIVTSNYTTRINKTKYRLIVKFSRDYNLQVDISIECTFSKSINISGNFNHCKMSTMLYRSFIVLVSYDLCKILLFKLMQQMSVDYILTTNSITIINVTIINQVCD